MSVQKLAPFLDQTESAAVVTVPIVGTLTGLAYATRLAVQAAEPIVVYGSITGAQWHAVAFVAEGELASLPFLEQLRIEPETAAATLLVSFPLR